MTDHVKLVHEKNKLLNVSYEIHIFFKLHNLIDPFKLVHEKKKQIEDL